MVLRTAQYEDTEGRRRRVLLPETLTDEEAEMGIPNGPPLLTALQLPADIEVKLHNELFNRGLFTLRDIRKAGRPAIQAALMAALSLDVERVLALYQEFEVGG